MASTFHPSPPFRPPTPPTYQSLFAHDRLGFTRDKVAVNVNADEAAVMGAALYGAGLSRQFKTKDIRLHGVAPYAIGAEHEVDAKGSGELPSVS